MYDDKKKTYSLFECLDSQPVLSNSSIRVTATESNVVDDNMASNNHERTVHPTSKLYFIKYYLSVPPQHPLRFITLSAQVCFYYLAYGYLQVRFIEI